MGRNKKLGNEICPKCGKLCRFRLKTARGRSTGKYKRRWFARHNDMTEHYIDNYISIQSCKCKTCKRVKAMIKHIQEMTFETITMNKDRYLEDFTDLLK